MFYCILTAEREEGSTKITIYSEQYTTRGRKKPSPTSRKKLLFDDGSPDDVAKQVFDSLTVDGGGKVLL